MKPNAKLAQFLKETHTTLNTSNTRIANELNVAYNRIAELEHSLDYIRETFQRAVDDYQAAHSPAHGPRVPYHGDFCSITPSTVKHMKNWITRWDNTLAQRISVTRTACCSCWWSFGDDTLCPVHGKFT